VVGPRGLAGDRGGHFRGFSLLKQARSRSAELGVDVKMAEAGTCGQCAAAAVDLALIAYLHLPEPGACRCAAGGREDVRPGGRLFYGACALQLARGLAAADPTCYGDADWAEGGGTGRMRVRELGHLLRHTGRGKRDRHPAGCPRWEPRRPTQSPEEATAARPGMVGKEGFG